MCSECEAGKIFKLKKRYLNTSRFFAAAVADVETGKRRKNFRN